MTGTCTAGVNTNFADLSYAKVTILGLVQGISELLPISSTAHMRIVPALLGWQDPGSAFSAAMQMAALVAVIFFFRSDLIAVASGSFRSIKSRRFDDPDVRLLIFMIVATVPIVIAGWVASGPLNACNSPFRSLTVIAWSCIGLGLLLALAELLARHVRQFASVTLLDAVLVGLAQVGALIPGVSRSGSTITASLGLGFKRDDAARLSFLIGIPAIALAGLRELWVLHHAHLSSHGWAVLGVGLVTASASAFVGLWLLMRILERWSSWPFAIYRVALGILLLFLISRGWR